MARLVRVEGTHYLANGAGYYTPAAPALTLSVVSTTFSEGSTLTFRVTADRVWDEDITVAYATSNGTGTAGVDYVAASGSVVIPAGDTDVDLSVLTIDREGVQSNRTFTLTLSAPTTPSGTVPTLATAAQTVTIEDTDVAIPVPSLVVSVVGTAEEGSPLTFRVSTQDNAPTPTPLTFLYEATNGSAADGVDFTATSGSGFIATGASSQEFPVQTIARSGYQPPRTVVFSISGANTTVTTASVLGYITDTEFQTGPHGYWESLQADPAFQASMSESFRNQAQIDAISQSSPNIDVTYAPTLDTYERPKDAAKVLVRPWQTVAQAQAKLVAPMSATDMTMSLANLQGDVTKVTTSLNSRGRQIIVDDEAMILTETQAPLNRATGVLTIGQRGALGTTATSHDIGARPRVGGSALDNQPRKPLDTEDGYTYLLTWDWCHTKRWLRTDIGNYKAFQLRSDGIWWESQHMMTSSTNNGFDPNQHVCWAGRVRSYCNTGGNADFTLNTPSKPGRLGPGFTGNQPVVPYANAQTSGEFPFLVYPDRWCRSWIRIQQRANDYAILDQWIADEQQEAVQVYSNVLVEVRGLRWNTSTLNWDPPRTIRTFDVEFHTSNAYVADGIISAWPELGLEAFRDLYSYVKNFAVLRWTNGSAPDISTYLVKPEVES